MNCRLNYTGEDSLIEKIWSPLPRHLYVSNILKKNITKKVTVATIFDPKRVIRNKQYYLTNYIPRRTPRKRLYQEDQ